MSEVITYESVPAGAILRYERLPKPGNKGFSKHIRIYDLNGRGIVERIQPYPAIWEPLRTADEFVNLQHRPGDYEPVKYFYIIDTFWPHSIMGPYESAAIANERAAVHMPDGAIVIIVEPDQHSYEGSLGGPTIKSWAEEQGP